MGYRSDVVAVFYVSNVEHLPLLKLWLSENFPMETFAKYTRWFNRGMVFEEDGTKWYEDYDEVKAFNKAADNFKDLIQDFDNSPVEGQPMFCYEFIRVGENYDDIETDHCGDHCEFLLNVERNIIVDM